MVNLRLARFRGLALLLAALVPGTLAAQTTLPAGTALYGELQERVTSKKKETTVGDIVRATVWRDVVVNGRTLIRAGTPIVTRVSHVKPAKIAGRKGQVLLEAVSTRAVDGNEVLLDGGYDKSGKGNKALAWTLFALVAWPLVFIKGKQAILDPGTVFDAAIQADHQVRVEGTSAAFRLRLSDAPSLDVEVVYEAMDPDAKQKILPLLITSCGEEAPAAAEVVTVNEAPIDEIPVSLGEARMAEDCWQIEATIDLARLAKTFSKGINRFVIDTGGNKAEVILEIEL